jgi:hypothetical protein
MIAQSRDVPAGQILRGSPLNAGDEASCLSIADVNVPDGGGCEASKDRGFNVVCAWPFAMENQAVVAIRLKRERKVSQLFGKAVRSGERFAFMRVNKDRAGRRVCIEPCKWIKGEKQPLVLTDSKLFQA